jgi:hypothetical protein
MNKSLIVTGAVALIVGATVVVTGSSASSDALSATAVQIVPAGTGVVAPAR